MPPTWGFYLERALPLPHILFHSYMQPYSSWSSLLLISFSIFSHFFNYLPYFPCPCPFSFLSLSVSSFVCTGPQSEICSMEQGLFHGSSHFQTSASPRHKAAGSALYSHRNVRYYRIEGTYCVICVIWSWLLLLIRIPIFFTFVYNLPINDIIRTSLFLILYLSLYNLLSFIHFFFMKGPFEGRMLGRQ